MLCMISRQFQTAHTEYPKPFPGAMNVTLRNRAGKDWEVWAIQISDFNEFCKTVNEFTVVWDSEFNIPEIII